MFRFLHTRHIWSIASFSAFMWPFAANFWHTFCYVLRFYFSFDTHFFVFILYSILYFWSFFGHFFFIFLLFVIYEGYFSWTINQIPLILGPSQIGISQKSANLWPCLWNNKRWWYRSNILGFWTHQRLPWEQIFSLCLRRKMHLPRKWWQWMKSPHNLVRTPTSPHIGT